MHEGTDGVDEGVDERGSERDVVADVGVVLKFLIRAQLPDGEEDEAGHNKGCEDHEPQSGGEGREED